ncbi:MAG: hypothetical protein ACXVX7_00075 [Mycobacterium sp.]
MKTTTAERTPFIAPLVDNAAQFVKEHGAVTVGELAEYLSTAGVNVSGDDELTGEKLTHLLESEKLLALPVIAAGSAQFVRITTALLVNRNVSLDTTNSTLLKLTWDDHHEASRPTMCKTRTGGHYHILTVRDPGGSQQVAECWEGEVDLTFAIQYLNEIYLPDFVDEGWEAIWIVGCGPEHCRKDEICNLSVEEWGAPHWSDQAIFPGADESCGEAFNGYFFPPDVVAAAREFIRSEGAVVSICELLDELRNEFGDRFSVSPDTYRVLDLIETVWADPHVDQAPNTGHIEFAWNEKVLDYRASAAGLRAMLLHQ